MYDAEGRLRDATPRMTGRMARAVRALGGRVRWSVGWPISSAFRTPVRAAVARRNSSWLLLADGRPSLIATTRHRAV